MLATGWRVTLVLGGIGSGRSEFARSLLTGAPRRLTADPGADPGGLARLLAEATSDETVLVDPVDAWLGAPAAGVPGEPAPAAADAAAAVAEAVRGCAARVVLVGSEVGLGVPAASADRGQAERVGAVNRALADVADAVALVVAGQPIWLKGVAAGWRPATVAAAEPAATPTPDLLRLSGLSAPDEQAASDARQELTRLGAVRLGALERVVTFAAATQARPSPAPWRLPRVLVLRGDHAGAAAAGAEPSEARVAGLRAGASPLALLAGEAGAQVRLVEADPARPIEDGAAMSDAAAEEALGYGWRLAEQAVDEGVDLLVLGSVGEGAETAAAAVVAVNTNHEPAALLDWVLTREGTVDDAAWVRRCAAVRDAVHRVRAASRTAARALLAELGGPDVAIATGVLLGAAARRVPVMFDGPVGAAAALVARALSGHARHWWLLPDHGGHPTVRVAAEALRLTPLIDLRLSLGEGATACAALPLLRGALRLAATLRTEA